MMLGVLLHAHLPVTDPVLLQEFHPGAEPPEAGLFWYVLPVWIHQWRMPVFFILSGFFAAMVSERRGGRVFLRDRTLRIFGTMVVFMALFAMIFDVDWDDLNHLWFLWFLFQFCLISLGLRAIGAGRVLRRLLWVMDRPARMALLIFPMMLLALFAKEDLLGQRIPDSILQWEPRGLIYFGAFFAVGFGLWYRRDRLEDLARPRVWGGLLATTMALAAVVVALLVNEVQADLLLVLIVPLGQLGLILGIIGMAQDLVRSSGPVLRFLVESAYAVYLFHIFPVLIIGAELIGQGWGAGATILTATAATLALCLVLYLLLVRYTPVDWLLAGPRNARFRWPRRKPASQ